MAAAVQQTPATKEDNVVPQDGAAEAQTQAPAPAADHNEDKVVTVFHDPEHFTHKHPLMHEWVLWYTKPPSGRGENWNDLLQDVCSFNSVEEFWAIHNNIQPPSTLSVKADYHLFKKNVRPEWEDPENKHGGKWSFSIKDKDRNTVSVDRLWLMTQLTAIGELFEEEGENEVMGVVANVRKTFYRIGLWTRTTGKATPARSGEKGEQTLKHIGKRFREALSLNPNIELEFSGHTETQQMGSTRAKAKYTA